MKRDDTLRPMFFEDRITVFLSLKIELFSLRKTKCCTFAIS